MRISNCMWIAVVPLVFSGWLVSGGEVNYPPICVAGVFPQPDGKQPARPPRERLELKQGETVLAAYRPRHSPAYGVLWQIRTPAGLQASFRSGQTFLTWTQSERSDATYRIYRATTPVRTSQDLTAARLLATVDSFSSLNLMACVNRWELYNMRPPQEYQLRRKLYFIIREGDPPLSASSGLYVYTAKANETAYYAVVSSAAPQAVMASDGVAEKIEPIAPVRQNDQVDYVHWTDDGTPYIFRVRAPGGKGPYPMIGVLHGGYFQYDTPDADRWAKVDGAEANIAIRVAMDAPILAGKIHGIPARELPSAAWSAKINDDRVLWTLDWVARHYPVDPDRVSLRGESNGGIGSLTIGMLHPERFAVIHSYVPLLGAPHGPDPSGGRALTRLNPTEYIQSHPEVEFPYLMITVGRHDTAAQWPDKPIFARVAQAFHIGFSLYWDARAHTYSGDVPTWGEPGGMSTMPITAFSRKQSFPAISELSANSNPGTVNLAVRPEQRPPLDAPGVGDLVGTINGWVDWDRASLLDAANRYAITLRLTASAPVDTATAQITPRRLQEFRPVSGRQYRFRVTDAGGKMLKQGQVLADRFGRITIGPVPLTKAGSRLTVQP